MLNSRDVKQKPTRACKVFSRSLQAKGITSPISENQCSAFVIGGRRKRKAPTCPEDAKIAQKPRRSKRFTNSTAGTSCSSSYNSSTTSLKMLISKMPKA